MPQKIWNEKKWKKYVNDQEKMMHCHIKLLFEHARNNNLPKVKKGTEMFASIMRNTIEALERKLEEEKE